MTQKKGRSEKKTGWLGNSYIQHYDSEGNKNGRSVRKEGFFGGKYTEHYDSKGNKRGRSEQKETFWGRKYTRKYDADGNESGTSEKKETFFGNRYTKHYDSQGKKTDRSVKKEGFWGNKYVERYSDEPVSSGGGSSLRGDGRFYSASSYDRRSKSSGKGFRIILVAAIILVIWFFSKGSRTIYNISADMTASPPEVVAATGACPFEGCQLGKWVARETIPVFEQIDGQQLHSLHSGDVVHAVLAEIRAIPQKARITKTYRTDEEQGLHVGDIVYPLYPLGEGAVAIWDNGNIVEGSMDLAFDFEGASESDTLVWTWWVKVLLADGSAGWLQNPQGRLGGMDSLSVD
ncbi:MAG: hypothetical protein F9K32_12250 [Desulfobulbaceae bacterium]|nr:MAG: hypothetical protein F9K32_12250 [Desulfobulbaceae bacterium]